MIRPCNICDQEDDGPRHAIASMIIDGTEEATYHHHACGAAVGCESCVEHTEKLNGS